MWDAEGPVMRWLWPALASLAGAITALSFRPFRQMTPGEIAMTLFVAASFSWFVSPWVVHTLFGGDLTNERVLGLVFYVMASGSNYLIPFAVRWLGKPFGAHGEESRK